MRTDSILLLVAGETGMFDGDYFDADLSSREMGSNS